MKTLGNLGKDEGILGDLQGSFLVSGVILAIAVFSANSRRLHDIGFSGWLQVPIIILGITTSWTVIFFPMIALAVAPTKFKNNKFRKY